MVKCEQRAIYTEPQETRLTNKSSAHILGDVSDLIKSLRSFATREAEWHCAFALCDMSHCWQAVGGCPGFRTHLSTALQIQITNLIFQVEGPKWNV